MLFMSIDLCSRDGGERQQERQAERERGGS